MNFYNTCIFFILLFGLGWGKKTQERSFSVDWSNRRFIKDGKPWQYISGSIHYTRIHPDYWDDRLQRARALGINAIQTYVPWFIHEPVEGQFDYSGFANLTRFLSIAQKNGLNVLFRPGPYICAEMEYGGLPWWLLKYENIKLRSSDSIYIGKIKNYYTVLLDVIKPFLYKNGGPILMVQIENEYGYMGACDHNYTTWLRDFVWSKLGNDVVLYTTDNSGKDALACGKVKGSVMTTDFGPMSRLEIDGAFTNVDLYSGGAPRICSEFYTDWWLAWKIPKIHVDLSKNAPNMTLLLDSLSYMHEEWNASVNLFMIHGGTNFGFINGNKDQGPIITSYWVNSPIAENGNVNEMYLAIRAYIKSLPNWENPPLDVPKNHPISAYGEMTLTRIGSSLISTLSQILESCQSSQEPMTFEQLDHGHGFVLYTTTIKQGGAILVAPKIKDYGYVFVNNIYRGMINRDVSKNLTLDPPGNHGDTLRILVENRGRQDFYSGMTYPEHDVKGLRDNVTLSGTLLQDWVQCGINLTSSTINMLSKNFFKIPQFKRSTPLKFTTGPGVYVGKFSAHPIQDTYLDTTGLGKGQLFINGHNLGRYWPTAGPQMTLYVPKPFLKEKNTVLLLELIGSKQNYVNFVDHPIFVYEMSFCGK